MVKELRIGIIGVNTSGGWAAEAHVPAVRATDGLTLNAVATSRQQTADEAAHAFGAERAYAGGLALIADPDIDIVTVATRVPDHRELLLAAMAAGKHVYSEWPLGAGSTEAGEIADTAQKAGIHHAIGLQLRGSPAVARARDILSAGSLGRILSVSALSTTAGFGPDVASQFAYLEDPATFANMITIQGAHTLDLLTALGGGIASMTALASRQFPQVRVGEPPRDQTRVTFDHLLVHGRFGSNVPFGVEVAGGRKGETPFHLNLQGETGQIRLEGGAPRGVQAGRLTLVLNGKRQDVEEHGQSGLTDGALNVSGIYRMLRDDIQAGTFTVPDFSHAERLTRLVEDVLVYKAK